MITVIKTGTGNFGSILNMLKKLGQEVQLTSDPKEIASSQKLILPGVGSFDRCMESLSKKGLKESLTFAVMNKKIPILGICVGMQMFLSDSEEGNLPGLDWIAGSNKKFDFGDEYKALKVPHMGWNYVTPAREDSLLWDFDDTTRFYFVHSYYADCTNMDQILLRASYGIDFTCAVRKDNIYGVQFHPEKSHKYGFNFFKNFIAI